MNILIAIVSDAYSDAMKRSVPLFWRARCELIAEYEPLLPKLENDELSVIYNNGDLEGDEKNLKKAPPPATWQYKCLLAQEGIVGTGVVFGLVLFELIYVGGLRSKEDTEVSTLAPSFWWGLGVTLLFLGEILLRYYVWRHTVRCFAKEDEEEASFNNEGEQESESSTTASPNVSSISESNRPLSLNGLSKTSQNQNSIGGFFWNKFRLLDATIVLVDVVFLIIEIALFLTGGSGDKSTTKAAVKLGRVVRLSRGAKWIRATRALRSCRFLVRLSEAWRKSFRPTRSSVRKELLRCFNDLEKASGWAGRLTDPYAKVRVDVSTSKSALLEAIGCTPALAVGRKECGDIAGRLAATEIAVAHVAEKTAALVSTVDAIARHLQVRPQESSVSESNTADRAIIEHKMESNNTSFDEPQPECQQSDAHGTKTGMMSWDLVRDVVRPIPERRDSAVVELDQLVSIMFLFAPVCMLSYFTDVFIRPLVVMLPGRLLCR